MQRSRKLHYKPAEAETEKLSFQPFFFVPFLFSSQQIVCFISKKLNFSGNLFFFFMIKIPVSNRIQKGNETHKPRDKSFVYCFVPST